jgi:hypothetical protein
VAPRHGGRRAGGAPRRRHARPRPGRHWTARARASAEQTRCVQGFHCRAAREVSTAARHAAAHDDRRARVSGQREARRALRQRHPSARGEQGVPGLRAPAGRARPSGLGSRGAARRHGRDAGALGLCDAAGVFANAVRGVGARYDGGIAPALDPARAELLRWRATAASSSTTPRSS